VRERGRSELERESARERVGSSARQRAGTSHFRYSLSFVLCRYFLFSISFCWLCNDSGDTCCCYRVGRSLREVQMMHAAFGSMLYTLASYDELEAINQAKVSECMRTYAFNTLMRAGDSMECAVALSRVLLSLAHLCGCSMCGLSSRLLQRQFIRYIFHEVRVPFNAIVMGIEQMQIDLAPHQLTVSSTLETLDILREQSAVVSRILNDVLSMQKIEDGALALEYDTFSLEKMIRGALYAFRTPCLEKRLKVRVNLQCLDELVNGALPGLRLGKVRIRSSKGGGGPSGISGVSAGMATTASEALGNGQVHRQHFMNFQQRHNSTHSNTLGSEMSINHPAPEIYHAQVRGDPYRLRQCLANFVSNAIKVRTCAHT
jgi:hypothetical protein